MNFDYLAFRGEFWLVHLSLAGGGLWWSCLGCVRSYCLWGLVGCCSAGGWWLSEVFSDLLLERLSCLNSSAVVAMGCCGAWRAADGW